MNSQAAVDAFNSALFYTNRYCLSNVMDIGIFYLKYLQHHLSNRISRRMGYCLKQHIFTCNLLLQPIVCLRVEYVECSNDSSCCRLSLSCSFYALYCLMKRSKSFEFFFLIFHIN